MNWQLEVSNLIQVLSETYNVIIASFLCVYLRKNFFMLGYFFFFALGFLSSPKVTHVLCVFVPIFTKYHYNSLPHYMYVLTCFFPNMKSRNLFFVCERYDYPTLISQNIIHFGLN